MEIPVNEKTDPFWRDDLSVLYNTDRLTEFVPTLDMSISERLNAIVRFASYLGTVLAMIEGQVWPFYIVLFALALSLFIYDNHGPAEEDDTSGFAADAACVMPTDENPFMNPLQFEEPEKPPACQYDESLDDPGVSEMANDKFMKGLYVDSFDLFERNNSQRQFYSVPGPPRHATADARHEFAMALYGNAPSCKSDPYDCVPFERLQQKRPIYPFSGVNPSIERSENEDE